jgi:uncharacterized protein
MAKHNNHLIHETSPYLLQHAHNPVDWHPWSDEALAKAKKEDKPILVSIGYAACHWCHVMERESFEDEITARIMNENFVNIKIDREERPDLDHIYMDAVQAMTGSGGWPLNVFLTPEAKPFYGGTYFPPKRAFNRPSWQEILLSVKQAFTERRGEIDAQAQTLTDHIFQSNAFGLQNPDDANRFSREKIDEAFQNVMQSADREWGGFGRAPKFPQTFTIQFLLRYHHVTKNEEALNQVLLSLDKMIDGGIYDQIGGGFARYSTDTEWLAPHFEKMLYDNALLVAVLSEAYQLTKKEKYKQVIDETMTFIQRELLDEGDGFYSALDADSEGEEGKFYVWNKDDVNKQLGTNSDIFCRFFDITDGGNWEGKNILRIKMPPTEFARQNNISQETLKSIIESGKQKLLDERSKRVRPLLDDKIILGWNALMNTACSKAFIATGNKHYRQLAIRNMHFLMQNFSSNKEEFNHTWKNGNAKYPAFLDDYAFLIQALIQLQEITADANWLFDAERITRYVIENFSEPQTGFFYFTKSGQQDVIVRKKEVYDGAIPSGNSVMAYNLYRLGIFFDRKEWKERAMKMAGDLQQVVSRYPTSFGIWACLQLELNSGTYEIAIIGKNPEGLHADLFHHYLPHSILMVSESESQQFPLIAGKKSSEKAMFFLCKDFACQQPVTSIDRFMLLINRP